MGESHSKPSKIDTEIKNTAQMFEESDVNLSVHGWVTIGVMIRNEIDPKIDSLIVPGSKLL